MATGADRVQRNHGGGFVGMPNAQNRIVDPERLHKCGRRRSRCRSSNATRPERVHVASLPRNGCGTGLFLIQTVEQPVHAQTTIVLGAHQSRHCKYR